MEATEIKAGHLEPLRLAVRSFYDAQKLRIEMGNRIAAQVRADTISPEWEGPLLRHSVALSDIESEIFDDISGLLEEVDIAPWLLSIRGIGPTLAGVLVSEIQDPGRFDTVSKLWAYSGLHVIDGRGVRRERGKKSNWNAFLKAKLIEVLGKSFLKCGNEKYGKLYADMKTRLSNRPCWKSAEEHNTKKVQAEGEEPGPNTKGETPLPNGCTMGHVEIRARRYMVKMFLADLWGEWRKIRGLSIRPSYAEEYLGKKHSA
ncbi:MAG TPA: transposase [Candidatus Polarisedimenticolia bacterium]|jgi:hypothetical protein